MDTNRFLMAVLPSQGKYCTFIARGNVRKNIFVDDLQNLIDTNVKNSASGAQTYFALSSYDDEGYRKAANTVSIRTIAMDLDCGFEMKKNTDGDLERVQKAFPSKRAAVEALGIFLAASGLDTLGAPWLLDSGGGVHVYWPLDADAEIAEWKPIAETLKQVAHKLHFPIDNTVTADAARVLRMPGTLNWKYTPPKPVELRQVGDIFSLESIHLLLAQHSVGVLPPAGSALMLPGTRPTGKMSAVAKAMAGNSVTYFKNIMVRTAAGEGCGQLKYYTEHAREDGIEPLWRGLLSWAKCCDDGPKAANVLSGMHPYDTARMHAKYNDITGPYPCTKMNSENPGVCGACPQWGVAKNALVFGRAINTVTERPATPPEEDDTQTFRQPQQPQAPRGFSYGVRGGVYYNKPSEKPGAPSQEIMLTSYDFYMTRMFRDGSAYHSEFTAVKGTKRITFTVPNKEVTSMAECVKTLAANNIIAVSGAGCDAYMYAYVRASMIEASVTENVVNIPPRYGWQDDGSFAVGDMVLSSAGPAYNYSFVSDRIDNLIKATQTKGSIQDWAKVFHMMRDKGLFGHLACAGAGFGSVLMQFMPAGSRACTLHMCSRDTGAGKSLAQAMAISVWGDTSKYLVASTTSERTMLQRAGLLGSLPLCIDEITNKSREFNREWLPKYVFDYSAGMHKIKGSAAGNTEIQHDVIWSGISILTSNTPGLEAMMGARAHSSEGEARRMLEWEQPKGAKIQWAPAERETLKHLEHNFGHAGRVFAQWCVTHQDTVKEVMEKVKQDWVLFSAATDEERFWTSTITCILAGYLLAGPKYANLLEIPLTPIRDFWLRLVNRTRTIINSNQSSAMDIFNAYVREHHGHFVGTEGSIVMQNLLGGAAISPSSTKSAVRGRLERNVTPGYTDFYVEVKMLRMHCAELGVGYSEFLEELGHSATLSEGRKDLLAGTPAPSMRVLCIKVSRTAADVKADEI